MRKLSIYVVAMQLIGCGTAYASTGSGEEVFPKLMVLIFLALVGIGIFYGVTDRAVFYRDTGDIFVPFCAPLAMIGFGALGAMLQMEYLIYVGAIVAVGIIAFVFKRSFDYNVDFIPSFTVALAKVALSWIYIFKIMEIINPGGKTMLERSRRRGFAILVVALLTPLVMRLVNGERVFANRGVGLPVAQQ